MTTLDSESLTRQRLRYRDMQDGATADAVNRFLYMGVRLAVFYHDAGPPIHYIEQVGAAPVTDEVTLTAEEFLALAIRVWRTIASNDQRTVYVIGQSPDSGAWYFYVREDDRGTDAKTEWVTTRVGGVVPAGNGASRPRRKEGES